MKFSLKQSVISLTLLAGLSSIATMAHADKLDDIKKAGVVNIAVFDSNPPFGYVDPETKKIVGYDVDIANAIGKATESLLFASTKFSNCPP